MKIKTGIAQEVSRVLSVKRKYISIKIQIFKIICLLKCNQQDQEQVIDDLRN